MCLEADELELMKILGTKNYTRTLIHTRDVMSVIDLDYGVTLNTKKHICFDPKNKGLLSRKQFSMAFKSSSVHEKKEC